MNKQKQIVQRLTELLPSMKLSALYGLAGRMIKLYGSDATLETLAGIQPGFPVGYYIAAVRNGRNNRQVVQDLAGMGALRG